MSVSNSECQVAFYWEAKRSPVTSAFGCVEISWKTLRYNEFTSAASRGTIPSGFTLRLCCFQCSRVWLGVDSAVLTHVTISRWRWASATFKKKRNPVTPLKTELLPSPDGTNHPQREKVKHWRKPDQDSRSTAVWFLFELCREELMRLFFFLYRSCVLTPATPRFWCGFTVKVAPVRHCREHRRDNYSGIIRGDRLS